MRVKIALLSLLGLTLLGGLYAWRPVSAPVPPPGFSAPAFGWTDLQGQSHRLSDFAGKVVVLHFWASWCAPCRVEFPPLLQTAAAMPEIIFLTISSDNNRDAAQRFLDALQAKPRANLFFALDAKKQITYDLFMTSAYPETVILDKQHRLRRKIPGVTEWENETFRASLRALQNEP